MRYAAAADGRGFPDGRDDARVPDVEAQLHDAYFTEELTLRDAQGPSKLYLSAKKFQGVFPGRTPEFQPTPDNAPTPAANAMKLATALLAECVPVHGVRGGVVYRRRAGG